MFSLFTKKENKNNEMEYKKYNINNKLQNMNFFLENYNTLKIKNSFFLKTIGVLSFGIFISIGLNLFMVFNQPTPIYFAITSDMKLIKLVSLSEPYITDNVVKQWIIRTINNTLAIDFKNYEETLLNARKFFSKDAHTSLINSMQQSNIIKVIKDKRIICTPKIITEPKILLKKVVNGIYVWKIELDLSLSYEGLKGVEFVQNMKAEIIVQRISTLENSEGINIRRIEFKEVGVENK